MDAYLTVGGVPEYLHWIKDGASVFLSLCQHAFKRNSLFLREFDKIFVSSMSGNPHYKKTIEFLSKRRFATRREIMQYLKAASGGSITKLFVDLELCEFIQRYVPYNLNETSPSARYAINDEYLQFYFRFVQPIKQRIEAGEFDRDPVLAINRQHYAQWLGYVFERFCRRYYYIIAKILGFPAVEYQVGCYFSRKTDAKDPGFQIDLLFDRKDRVYTVCEIKYKESKINVGIIDEFEHKLECFPNEKHYTIQRVLITNTDADEGLKVRRYFDRIITLTELFDANHWV